ncbi:transcriptional regulator BetI [Ruegeria sp. MALMAid1280]|uniref:transcriptional regulator BetI n=1 Tax=Ruegeria sp. MALMAid1280 TaxID=3411634 RepID=UPI003BA27502
MSTAFVFHLPEWYFCIHYAEHESDPNMRKQTIKNMRRKQLTEAAFEILKTHGIAGTTIDRIAKEAGVSKGVVQHYFPGKEALFEAVLRETNAKARRCVTALLAHSDTPSERLYAILYGYFAPPFFQHEFCCAWVSLCAEVPQNAQYLRVQNAIHSRTHSNLMSALRHLVEPALAEQIAFNLTTLIDGIWMRTALQAKPISPAEAVSHMEFALNRLFRDTAVDSANLQAAREKIAQVSGILFKI